MSAIGLHRADGLTGRGESFDFFFFTTSFPSLPDGAGLGLGAGFGVRGGAAPEDEEDEEELWLEEVEVDI